MRSAKTLTTHLRRRRCVRPDRGSASTPREPAPRSPAGIPPIRRRSRYPTKTRQCGRRRCTLAAPTRAAPKNRIAAHPRADRAPERPTWDCRRPSRRRHRRPPASHVRPWWVPACRQPRHARRHPLGNSPRNSPDDRSNAAARESVTVTGRRNTCSRCGARTPPHWRTTLSRGSPWPALTEIRNAGRRPGPMIDVLAYVLVAAGLLLGVLARHPGLPGPAHRRRADDRCDRGELGLLVQSVIGIVRLGSAHLAEPVTFLAYAVGILLPLPLGFYLARIERTRWGSIILGFTAIVVGDDRLAADLAVGPCLSQSGRAGNLEQLRPARRPRDSSRRRRTADRPTPHPDRAIRSSPWPRPRVPSSSFRRPSTRLPWRTCCRCVPGSSTSPPLSV